MQSKRFFCPLNCFPGFQALANDIDSGHSGYNVEHQEYNIVGWRDSSAVLSSEHAPLLQRPLVRFPALARRLAAVSNLSSRGPDGPLLKPGNVHGMQTGFQALTLRK